MTTHWLAQLPAPPAPLIRLIESLPWQPPSIALAAALQRLLWPRLDAAQRSELQAAVVEVRVLDLGLRCRVWLTPRGFACAPRDREPRLRLVARAEAYWRLLRAEEDPDRLFFERALVAEGDTEFGLLLKNTLDAVGPLWRGSENPGSHRA